MDERIKRLHLDFKDDPTNEVVFKALEKELARAGLKHELFWCRVKHKAAVLKKTQPWWKLQGLGVGRERFLRKDE